MKASTDLFLTKHLWVGQTNGFRLFFHCPFHCSFTDHMKQIDQHLFSKIKSENRRLVPADGSLRFLEVQQHNQSQVFGGDELLRGGGGSNCQLRGYLRPTNPLQLARELIIIRFCLWYNVMKLKHQIGSISSITYSMSGQYCWNTVLYSIYIKQKSKSFFVLFQKHWLALQWNDGGDSDTPVPPTHKCNGWMAFNLMDGWHICWHKVL